MTLSRFRLGFMSVRNDFIDDSPPLRAPSRSGVRFMSVRNDFIDDSPLSGFDLDLRWVLCPFKAISPLITALTELDLDVQCVSCPFVTI